MTLVWCRARGFALPFLLRLKLVDDRNGFGFALHPALAIHSIGHNGKHAAERFAHVFRRRYDPQNEVHRRAVRRALIWTWTGPALLAVAAVIGLAL